jgi:hypothetical protein
MKSIQSIISQELRIKGENENSQQHPAKITSRTHLFKTNDKRNSRDSLNMNEYLRIHNIFMSTSLLSLLCNIIMYLMSDPQYFEAI